MKPTLTLITALMLALLTALRAAHADVTLSGFMPLVRTETWTERWPNDR